ncbi:hypothetical protein Ddc_03075 [Ditylenchus destructor]|nr:hypothetical protein Ddc_03075 [Ditylenchus destructor]
MLSQYGILAVTLLLLASQAESVDESSSSPESSPEAEHVTAEDPRHKKADVSGSESGEKPNTKKPLMTFDLDVSSPTENVTLDENGEAIPGQKHKKHHLHFEMAKKARKPGMEDALPLAHEKPHVQAHQKGVVPKDVSKVVPPQILHPKVSHADVKAEHNNVKDGNNEYFINAKQSTIKQKEGEKVRPVNSSERHGHGGYHFFEDNSGESKFFDANHGRIVIDPQRDSIVACVDYLPRDTCKVLKPLCARSDTARAIRYLRERSDYIMYLSNDLQKHMSYVQSSVNDPSQEQLLRNLQEISHLLPSVKKAAPLIRLILDEDSEDELERLECAAHQKMCYKTHIPIYKRQKACALYDDICCCGEYKFHRYYRTFLSTKNLGNADPMKIESKEAKAMRRATRRFIEASCAATCGTCPTRYRIKEYAEDVRRAFDCDQKKIPVGHDLRVHFEEDPFKEPAKHHVTIQREPSSESYEDFVDDLPAPSYQKPPRDCPHCNKPKPPADGPGSGGYGPPASQPSYDHPYVPSYVRPANKPGYGPPEQHPIYF